MHGLLQRQIRKLGIEGLPTESQWKDLLERIDRAYVGADQERYTSERALELSSGEMRKRFVELTETRNKLVEASRKAGMADVAASVLHNVGNVLNSVNVSAGVVARIARSSSRTGLGKSLALLKTQPMPGRFIDEDPRGRKLLNFLDMVDRTLTEERDEMLREVDALLRNIEHIKVIVSQQLQSVREGRADNAVFERLSPGQILDDACVAVAASLKAPDAVAFVRDYQAFLVATDRHKLIQIVMNLLTNARDATAEDTVGAVITLRTFQTSENRVVIEVEDNGVGISEEVMKGIFRHGYSTKANGHGFGLHSSACAAMELGGTLTAHSEGPGTGARMRLELPGDSTGAPTLSR